eukprot:comp23329_c0_seq1/m.38426 comp23329_c0_seq1/g.38426  ORF comp23329_c0_seq1/g.38426 comp23329_c0_seq1/m.38426 type:complete len:799 (-) comp23329_c0_seq1:221-2617(-)
MKGKLRWLFVLLVVVLLTVTTVRAEDEDAEEAASTASPVASPAEKKHVVLEGLSEQASEVLLEQTEAQSFQAEVARMMKLIINSLYKNRDIFLRELISNASDALDKIRFLSLTNKDLLAANPELAIKIRADEQNGVLHIEDSGIGMTREHLSKNLGTIARSGTAEFMEALQQGDSNSLIGQFGVGFYSAFLVADTVVVTSKHNEDEQYIWESDASSYKIVKDPRGAEAKIARGTRISLYLKDEAKDFLKEATLKELISKYSQFINFPIYLYTSKQVDKEADVKDEKKDDETVETEDEGKKESKKETETVWDYEQLNTVKPIWTRSPKDISSQEYTDFFKTAFRQHEEPMTHMHFDAEGEISFKALLYVPAQGAAQLLNGYNKAKAHLKLFVRRVFITDELTEMLPKYLSFVLGLVDSDDLPLNVSRETLQQTKLVKLMRKKLVRKVLEMFKRLADAGEETYQKFWKEYGTFIKLGTIEDAANRAKLAKLLRYPSSHGANLTSLEDYVDRMKQDQEAIYYMPGLSLEEASSSPLVERLLKRGYEVLYFVEPVDEYTAGHLQEFGGKKLVNAAKKDLKLKESKGEQRALDRLKKRFDVLTRWLPKVLDKKIESAVVSNRLDKSPCVLVAQDWGVSGTMAKHMKAQGDRGNSFLADMPPVLELNPRHPLVQKLQAMVSALPEDQRASDPAATDLARTLHDTAVLRSGYELKDLAGFAERIERMLRRAADVPQDAQVDEEVLVDDEEDEDEDKEDDKKEDLEEIKLDDEEAAGEAAAGSTLDSDTFEKLKEAIEEKKTKDEL